MNREQAKEILAAYRRGLDDDDPHFAAALELARQDVELKQWLEQSLDFDRGVAAEVKLWSAPADLRAAILARGKIIRPVPWWHHRIAPAPLAAAAAVLFLLAFIGIAFAHRQVDFSAFRKEIVDRSWGTSPHVELNTSDVTEMQRFMAEHQVSSDFEVPPALASSLKGCGIVEWRGRQIPFACFASGGQHMHLVIADRELFARTPAEVPDMERWQSWRTASWSKASHTYILTGLSVSAFVKKFRNAGRWDWQG